MVLARDYRGQRRTNRQIGTLRGHPQARSTVPGELLQRNQNRWQDASEESVPAGTERVASGQRGGLGSHDRAAQAHQLGGPLELSRVPAALGTDRDAA